MGVEFVAANTDAQALKRSVSRTRSCVSARPASAPAPNRKSASTRRMRARADRRADALKGSHMVFITAGMGGGTGTGAGPIVAEVARSWAS